MTALDLARHRTDRSRAVAAIWSATAKADQTPARRYLANRFAWPPDGTGPELPEDCRWLAAESAPPDWHGLPKGAAGALVFGYRDRAGNLTGVMLEALDGTGNRVLVRNGRGWRRWRKHIGVTMGASFSAGGSGATLVLVEGEVSALACRWLHPDCRVIATGGTSGLRAWRPGPGERGPFLVTERNDDAGQKAALSLARALQTAGHACTVQQCMVGDPAADLSDALVERAAIVEFDGKMNRASAEHAAWQALMPEPSNGRGGTS